MPKSGVLNPEALIDKLAGRWPLLRKFMVQDPGTEKFSPEQLDNYQPIRNLIDAWFRISFEGLEHIPSSGRALLVGNHGRTGLDAFVFAAVASEHLGRPVRPLTDKLFFRFPGLRDFIAACGGVPGTRENASRLLTEDNLVVVYPGGNDEVMKPAFEAYQLSWGDRTGFVKVARSTNAPIIPVAGIGVEELYQNMPGFDSWEMSPLGRWLEDVIGRRYRGLPPIAGIGPLPNPVKLTFIMGEPIPTTDLHPTDEAEHLAFQRHVQAVLKKMMRDGLARRDAQTSDEEDA